MHSIQESILGKCFLEKFETRLHQKVTLLSRREAELQFQRPVISTISGRTHGNNQSFLHLS